jgi:small redox-active disulfide protein 2
MKIQVLGSGCPRCATLTANVEKAMRELGLPGEVEKITDMSRIVAMGVMIPPALAVDGKVLSSGHLLTPEQVKRLLMNRS